MSQEISGKYFGTEIDEKWYRRFRKNKMLARGNGVFVLGDSSISFLRKLTRTPISIELAKIKEIKTGSWHAGQWSGRQTIVKIVWEEEGQRLSSGFVLSLTATELNHFIRSLREKLSLG